MSTRILLALISFCVLIAFIIFISQIGDNDSKLYIGVVGTLLVFALIAGLAVMARGTDDHELQKQYLTIVGTLVGLVGGLVGGVAIGNQAGQTAADNVASDVQSSANQVKEKVNGVNETIKNELGKSNGTTTTP